jgi:hypothetical protein
MIQIIIALQLNRISHLKVDMAINPSRQSRLPQKVSYLDLWPLINSGKVERVDAYKPKNHLPSKTERRNTQKQIQKNKREEQIRTARFFGGARGAAKIVVSQI